MNQSIKNLALILALVILAAMSTYTINQTEQVIITQFGKPVGDPITAPGLHFKLPFIQRVNSFDKRYLAWDGPMVEMSTKDKTYVQVDTFARWRITEPMRYYLRLRDERSAQSRLEDILAAKPAQPSRDMNSSRWCARIKIGNRCRMKV